MQYSRNLVLFLIMIHGIGTALGSESEGPSTALKISPDLTSPEMMGSRTHLTFGLVRNFPLLTTAKKFKPATVPSPQIGFSYRYNYNWDLEVRAGLLRYETLESGTTELSILNLGFSSVRLFRLYHPVYLGAGAGVAYYYPSQRRTPPFQRHDEIGFESGAQIRGKILYLREDGNVWTLYLERWRSTRSYRLHGVTAGLGMGIPM